MYSSRTRTLRKHLGLALLAIASASCAGGESPPGYGTGTQAPGAGGNNPASPSGVGGGGGAAPLAGAGASGGAGSAAGLPAGCSDASPADVISDFETGSAAVANTGGRSGAWFLFNDGSGMQTPPKTPNVALTADMGGACNSLFAFHTKGTGFNVWGAGVGVSFTPGGDAGKASYDASGYAGISLMAKADKIVTVRFSVTDQNTAVEGGICQDTTDKTSKTRCGDYFGLEQQVGTDWARYTLSFGQAAQIGWGLPVATGVDKAHLFAFHGQVKGTAAAPANFELWLDDVRFVK